MTAPSQWKSVMEHLDNADGDLTADVETIITELIPHMSIMQWIIGDSILRLGGTNIPKVMDYFRKLSNKKPSTLFSWVQTCKNFPPDIRWQILADTSAPDGTPSLDFNHFRSLNNVVTEYGLDTAIDVLKLCADETYTIAQLNRHIITVIKGNDPTPPKPKLVGEVKARYEAPIRNGIFYIDGNFGSCDVGKEYILKVYEVQNES